MSPVRVPRLALAAIGLALAAGGARAGDDPAADFLAARAAVVVNVRSVLKVHISGGGRSDEREGRVEALGTLVDPSGLVLVSSAAVDAGPMAALAQLMGAEIKVTPQEIKVTVGGDGPEREAIVVAKDAVLGIAYLRLIEDPAQPLPAADLTGGAEPKVGAQLLAVGRKSEGFDRVPLLLRLYASGVIEKPRRAWRVAGDYASAGMSFGRVPRFVGGTLAYDRSGRAVGLLAQQVLVDADDLSAADVLLPLAVVAKSVESAKKLVPDALARAREAK